MEFPTQTTAPANDRSDTIPPFRLIDAPLKRVGDRIGHVLSGSSLARELEPLLGYLNARLGKMIRPGLVLLAGRCFGPITDRHIEVAAIVEMIHGATLLHDDVVDEGQVRRGAATINRVWGNESAVLLGDFVLSRVFRLVADLEPAVAKVVSDTAMRVCEGELRQAAHRDNWQLTEAEHLDIITEKSASFFSGCCRLGALLAGADEPQIEALASYGLHAGIAFQIIDDLLDIAGSERKTGKTVRCDLNQRKLTLALIHLGQTVDPTVRDEIWAMLDSPVESNAKLAEMLRDNGSLQYARDRALEHVRQAETSLASLPSTEAKDALVETARFVVNRTA